VVTTALLYDSILRMDICVNQLIESHNSELGAGFLLSGLFHDGTSQRSSNSD